MSESISRRHVVRALAAVAAGSLVASRVGRARAAAPTEIPLLPPAFLVGQLELVKRGEWLVLHVGRKSLFTHQRVPSARHAGELTTPAGEKALLAILRATPQKKPVVLYCGCCPMEHCQYIVAAQRVVQASRRKNVSVLDLSMNFDRDWVARGYPVEQG